MVRKYASAEEARLAKAACNRAYRARMKALGIRTQGDADYLETRVERKERDRVAKSCATPFRDANAHERGGKFKHEAVDHAEFSHSSTDFMTGDRTSYRGAGFYAGRRTNNG